LKADSIARRVMRRRRHYKTMLGAWTRLGRARRALPENVRALSWVSFTNDLASELAYPIVPLFLTVTLGAPVAVLGLIEGLAEGVAVGFRGISGRLSDKAGERRKPWIVGGYSLSALARPVIAAAPHWGFVLAGRLGDRLGKAGRTAPRDALIRDSTPPPLIGSAFGYHRALDTAGGFIGPLAAVVMLASGVSLRTALWVAVAPALGAVLLTARVREAPASDRREAMPTGPIRSLPAGFWLVLGAWVVFSLGNSSDVFLLLRSHQLGLSTTLAILGYAIYNAVYSLLAWPLGSLSDRVPRSVVLAGGVAVFALVYLGFALANGSWAVWPLFAVYGVSIAATDGVSRAWIGDHVPPGLAGTAYGLFAAASGAALLVASLAAGLLWSHVSPRAPFFVGAVGAALGVVAIIAAGARGSRPAAAS
jgi:MFS family permease